MSGGVLARGVAVLELLVRHPQGLAIHEIASRLGLPKSATHRILTELIRYRYVRQLKEHGEYALTLKLCSLGLTQLTSMGVADISQPILDDLARLSGETARLSVIDGDQLVWVAKAQGSTVGLRFDPDQGGEVDLLTTASGHAWLSCLSEEDAIEKVTAQGGFVMREGYGAQAPLTVHELLAQLHQARVRGFSVVAEAVHVGVAAVAAPVVYEPFNEPIAVISIAGPHVRLTDARLEELGPAVVDAARNLAATYAGSPYLQKAIADLHYRAGKPQPGKARKTGG